MSEYCYHCGTTISEDIAALCPLCALKPNTVRQEEIDEFASKLKTGAIPAQIVDGKPMYSGLNGAALASTLRAVSEGHQTVHQEDRERKALFAMAADAIDALIRQRRDHLNKIQSARLRYVHKVKGEDTAEAMYRLLVADESDTANTLLSRRP
jgi:uncharacterized membrane protein YqiK